MEEIPFILNGFVISSSFDAIKFRTTIVVENRESQRLKVVVSGECHAEKDDMYSGKVVLRSDGRYDGDDPFIQPPCDRDSIIEAIYGCLSKMKLLVQNAQAVVDRMIVKKGCVPDVIVFLNEVSRSLCVEGLLSKEAEELFSPDMKPNMMRMFLYWWYEHRSLRRLYLLGVTQNEVQEIKFRSIDKAYLLIKKNPYLVFELPIETCTRIFSRLRKIPTEDQFYAGQAARFLYQKVKNGSTCYPFKLFLTQYPKFTLSSFEIFKKDYELEMYNNMVYLNFAYRTESSLATSLNRLKVINTDKPLRDYQPFFLRKELDEVQKKAVKSCFTEWITVIDGQAGSGKTTVTKEVFHNAKIRGEKIAFVCPTGKAASRSREVIGCDDPSTIHSFVLRRKGEKFDHIVIDEAGMVSDEVFEMFFEAFPVGFYRLTLVGDPNQLDPIGFGSPFAQIIKSGQVPVTTLNFNYRCDQNVLDNDGKPLANNILVNADKIIHDEVYVPVREGNFILTDQKLQYLTSILSVIRDLGYSSDDVTVLNPYKEGLASINQTISEFFNSKKDFVFDSNNNIYRVGDRLRMLKNNYDLNIMNGEEGKIEKIDQLNLRLTLEFNSNETAVIDGDGVLTTDGVKRYIEFLVEKPKIYGKSKVPWIGLMALSFAKTVHSSQGSEYPYVIMYIPFDRSSGNFVNRNLIYTGLTRAQTAFYLLGSSLAFIQGANTKAFSRNEQLAIMMQKSLEVTLSTDI